MGVGDKARTVNELALSWYDQYEKFLFLIVDMEKKKGEEGEKNRGKKG